MLERIASGAAVALLLAPLAAQPAPGPATAVAPADLANDDWEVTLAPYFMLAHVDGDAGAGLVGTQPINLDPDDIFANFEAGIMGRVDVRKGRWGATVESAFLKLGADLATRTNGVLDAEFEQLMVEGLLFHRLGSQHSWIDLCGGVRYWDMDLDLDLAGPLFSGSLRRGDDWLDPFVGVRVVHYLSERWFLPARADIGGFGVGSDFSWNLQAGVGYAFSDHVAIVTQYKALAVDYSNDEASTTGFFEYDAIQHGALLGLVFRF